MEIKEFDVEDKNTSVPYIVYESEAARHERTIKRLIVAILVTICLLVGTNLAWLYVFNQYDITSTTTEVVTEDGNANMLEAGMNGEINNVNSDNEKDKDNEEAQ